MKPSGSNRIRQRDDDAADLCDPIRHKELGMRWATGAESGAVGPIDIPPQTSGFIEVPARHWKPGEKVKLEFLRNGSLVEQAELTVGVAPRTPRPVAAATVSLQDRVNDYLITGASFSLIVSKLTGLITEATLGQARVLEGGPFLDVGHGAVTSWQMTHSVVRQEENRIIIVTEGAGKAMEGIDGISVEFAIAIDGDGGINTRYRAEVKPGSYPSLGIAYLLPDSFDKLSWKRKAPWSVYPDDHIGRPDGVVLRRPSHPAPAYRQEPNWPWSQDTADPFLWGKTGPAPDATNDFRSLKPNIWRASLGTKDGKSGVCTEADADVAVRASLQSGGVCFSIYRYWSYPDLEWGNYTGVGAPPAVTTMESKIWLAALSDKQDQNARFWPRHVRQRVKVLRSRKKLSLQTVPRAAGT